MNYPEYDRNKYTVWALPHPLLLHWVLNPGLAINELILGQRIPKVTLIDKTLDKPFMERGFIPCPSCGTIHESRLWAKKNAFGHWFGYVCPSCGEIIPCLWNLTSLLILLVTSPIWLLPVKYLKPKWIEYEKMRLGALPIDYKDVSFTKMGILFGGFMWLFFGIAFPIMWKSLTWQFALTMLLWCALGGVFFAVVIKIWMSIYPNKK